VDVVLDFFAGGGSTLHAAQTHEEILDRRRDCEPRNVVLQRIGTFFGTKEVVPAPKRLRDCFLSEFGRG